MGKSEEKSEQAIEHATDSFASRLLREFRAEFDSNARLAKERIIRRLRLKLPPHPGRPSDPLLDRAFEMHRGGATAKEISEALLPELTKFDPFMGECARRGLLQALRRRRQRQRAKKTRRATEPASPCAQLTQDQDSHAA